MPASQHGARKAALLQGSVQYLQRGHAAYMQTIIQSHRSEVRLCSSHCSITACSWLTKHRWERMSCLAIQCAQHLDGSPFWVRVAYDKYRRTWSMLALQAALGGDPSRVGQIQAFLRIVDRDLVTMLDFDQPGGADTSWQRIYYCLRSGYSNEALQVRASRSTSCAGLSA